MKFSFVLLLALVSNIFDAIEAATCTCPNGSPTDDEPTLPATHFCQTDGSVDCYECDAGYTISAPAGPGAQTCVGDVCTVTGLSAPTNGALDAACANSASLAHSASCALTCNGGYTLSGTQPSCSAGTFSTGSVACAANVCPCTGGTATLYSGTGGTLCESNGADCVDSVDSNGGCPGWAARTPSECTENKEYMDLNCKLSCGLCWQEDCSACDAGYTISAVAALGGQTCVANVCPCTGGTGTTATGTGATLCETNAVEDCSACGAGYTISATAATGAQTCVANVCGCNSGTETTATGTGGTLCELDEREDCSVCNDGYYLATFDSDGYPISATAGAGQQFCEANMCGCDFGTETTATGTGGTLCELHEREDCSACDDGYYISATAATGAQTCTACTPVTGAATITCTSASDSVVVTCKSAYWKDTSGSNAVCTERTCAKPNSTDTAVVCATDMVGNKACSDKETGDGYKCDCKDAFWADDEGDALSGFNKATVCTERTCAKMNKAELSWTTGGCTSTPGTADTGNTACSEGVANDGYKCSCSASHRATTTGEVGAKVANAKGPDGANLNGKAGGDGVCTERTCADYNGLEAAAPCDDTSNKYNTTTSSAAVDLTTCTDNLANDGYGCKCDYTSTLRTYQTDSKALGGDAIVTMNGLAKCTVQTCSDTDGSGTDAVCGPTDFGQGKCVDMEKGWKCECALGFWGAKTNTKDMFTTTAMCTEQTCEDTDGNGATASCGTHASCNDDLTTTAQGNGWECVCNAGYKGDTKHLGAATCTVCGNGKYENASHLCQNCTIGVANAASDATYTCTSASNSKVSSCKSGYWKDTSGGADTCTECLAVANAVAGATYTCTSAKDSKVSGCAAGYLLDRHTGHVADTCKAVACPSNSAGPDGVPSTVPNTCTCNAGYFGTITAAVNGHTGSCLACQTVANAATSVTCSTIINSQVTACAAGYALTESGDAASADTCGAVACPANSAGTNVPSGCTCNADHYGAVTASSNTDRYTSTCAACEVVANAVAGATYTCTSAKDSKVSGCAAGYLLDRQTGHVADTCKAVACPSNSAGPNVPSTCTCDDGYFGAVTASSNTDRYTSTCAACATVTNAEEDATYTCTAITDSVVSGCAAGYLLDGTGTANTCDAVACPSNSAGTNVPSGCTCNDGFFGTIAAETTVSRFSGSCQQCEVVANAEALASYTCTSAIDSKVSGCQAGFSLHRRKGHTADTCDAVACPAHAHGDYVHDTCTCDDGYYGTITKSSSTTIRYTGECQECMAVDNAKESSTVTCTSLADSKLDGGCLAGYSLALGGSSAPDTCNVVACPTNSSPTWRDLPQEHRTNAGIGSTGCGCDAGYHGSIWAQVTETTTIGYDGVCEAVICAADHRVEQKACVACPDGTFSDAGADASQADTLCKSTPCKADFYVVDHECTKCLDGYSQKAGGDPAGDNTVCEKDFPVIAVVALILAILLVGAVVALFKGKQNSSVNPSTGADTMA